MTTENKAYKALTVLLVDDDDIDVMAVERAFKKLKISNPIIRARDGLEGLKLLRDPLAVERPYIVLLDINMPRMNGLEMLTELRNDPELSTAMVFVLTTSKADEDKIAAYQQHVAGYIVKKHIGDSFLQIIETLDHYWRLIEFPI